MLECNIYAGHDRTWLRINTSIDPVVKYSASDFRIITGVLCKCIEVLSRQIETKLLELNGFGYILRERIPQRDVS